MQSSDAIWCGSSSSGRRRGSNNKSEEWPTRKPRYNNLRYHVYHTLTKNQSHASQQQQVEEAPINRGHEDMMVDGEPSTQTEVCSYCLYQHKHFRIRKTFLESQWRPRRGHSGGQRAISSDRGVSPLPLPVRASQNGGNVSRIPVATQART